MIREPNRNKETGTVTLAGRFDEAPVISSTVVDAREWFARCEDHDVTVQVDTRDRALVFSHHPTRFCDFCKDECDRRQVFYLRVRYHGANRYSFSVVDSTGQFHRAVYSHLNREYVADELRERRAAYTNGTEKRSDL